MPLSADDARHLIESRKVLTGPFRWMPRWREESDRKKMDKQERPLTPLRLDLVSALAIDGVQPRGLRLRASVFPRRTNAAMFQLECAMVPPQGNRRHELYRMEWNPIRGHTNALDCADPDIAGMYFGPGDTHEHSCLDHLSGKGFVRVNDVHAARPIFPDPADFKDALTYVCARICIENGGDIRPPVAQGELV